MPTTSIHLLPSLLLAVAVLSAVANGQIEMPKPLTGVYTVDPKAKGDRAFKDLATAVRYLSLAGVSGEFRLEVQPGTYKGGLLFYPVRGLREDQKIVIKAVGQGDVVLTHEGAIARLNDGVSNLVFDGLVFDHSGTGPAIEAGSQCTDIEVRNCRFTKATGGSYVIEIQGRNGSRRWHIHHNTFEMGSGVQYGIYTQATYELDIHDNDFACDGCREPISIWNANMSRSRVHCNVFRGRVSHCCMRLDVSGHDVDVFDNLFVVQMDGNDGAVIRSQGLTNGAYNKIHHNVFVLPGHGIAVRTEGPLAINHNLYAPEDGSVGEVKNTVHEKLNDWRAALGDLARDEQADQQSAVALPDFFRKHARLLSLIHRFAAADATEEKPAAKVPEAMTPKEELDFLVEVLKDDDPVAVRLAIHLLTAHGRRAVRAVPALGRLCGHAHAAIRASAVRALGAIRIGAEIVIPELIKLLGEKDEQVLLETIRTLGAFEHLAAEAAPRMKILEGHESKAIKAAAATARRAVLGEPAPKKAPAPGHGP